MIGKEKEMAYRLMSDDFAEDDALDALVQQTRKATEDARAALRSVTPMYQPPRPPPQPMVPPHAQIMRSNDTIARVLCNNIFPRAAYRKAHNSGYEADLYGQPWQRYHREPINKRYYHYPNELSLHSDAAARMGLKPFGGDKR